MSENAQEIARPRRRRRTGEHREDQSPQIQSAPQMLQGRETQNDTPVRTAPSARKERTEHAEETLERSRRSQDNPSARHTPQLGVRGFVPEKITEKKKTAKQDSSGAFHRGEFRSMTGPTRQTTGGFAPQTGEMSQSGSMTVPVRQATGGFAPQTGGMSQSGSMTVPVRQATGGFAPQTGGMSQSGSMTVPARQITGGFMPQTGAMAGPGSPMSSPWQTGGNAFQGSRGMPVQQLPANAQMAGFQAQNNVIPGTMQNANGQMSNMRVHTGGQPLPPAQVGQSGELPKPDTSPMRSDVPNMRHAGTAKKRNQNVLRMVIIGVIVVAVLAIGGMYGVKAAQRAREERALRESVEAFDTVFCEGVYVDGIDLAGMTYDEALALVRQRAQDRFDSWQVRLTYQGQEIRTLRASDLSVMVDVQETMNEAWQQGHTGTVEERRAAMDALKLTPYEAYTANPGGDQSRLNQILQSLHDSIYQAPRNASIASFNPNLTYPFTFEEEVQGRDLDVEALRTKIYQSLSSMKSEDMELQIRTTEPEYTVEWIKANLLQERGFGSTPITYHSTENRNENIRVAFSRVSGTVLQPGQQFSFNDTVGQRTEKNGFLPAIEYAYGEVSDGIGGGVCQASTTIYLAAVRAGMQIVKREPHSDAVNYIAYGKDATVYWYSNHKIDLVFKNTTEHPVYITAAVQSDKQKRTNLVCNVRIYGETMHGVTYDIVTEETPIEAPMEPEYVKDRKGEYVTYTDEQKVVRQASSGCEAVSYRVAYQDGQEIERKYMYTDIYKPKAERIYVGVTPR